MEDIPNRLCNRGNPLFKEMLKSVYGVWNSATTPKVFLHNDGYFIFRFDSIEDKTKIIQNRPYTSNNMPIVLKEQDPDLYIQNESLCIIHVWVNFLGLPIQCWIEKKLGRIASLLGKPICTDKLTVRCERISYARVLIEMDITQPFPDELSIEKADGSIWEQKADFEWKPKFCMDCDQFGHNTDACE